MPQITASTGFSLVMSVRRALEPAATSTSSPIPAPTASAATTQLPVMPIYWDVDPILAVAGVKNVPPPSAPTRISTFNIWEWDKEA